MLGLHLPDDPVDGLDLCHRVDIGTVDDVQEQISVDDFFQGGAERLDQLGGQMPDETDGIGEDHRPAVLELAAAGGGFQGGEQRVLHQNAGSGEGVEQAGLAGVGVADDRDGRHVTVPASAALGIADLLHIFDLAAQPRHPLPDAATVGLDLGLTGATGTDAAAAAAGPASLPGHRLAPTAQPRQHVLHLGQFDLRFALPTAGVLGENVQDQRGAVDDLDLDHLLQRVQLRRAQFAVADDRVRAGGDDDLAQFDGFTGADVGGRIRFVAALDDPFENLRAGGLGQGRELGEAGVGIGGAALGPHPDEHHALKPELAVLDLRDIGEFRGQSGDTAQRSPVLQRQFAEAGLGTGGSQVRIGHGRTSMVSRTYRVARRYNVAHPRYRPRSTINPAPPTRHRTVRPARPAPTGHAGSWSRR